MPSTATGSEDTTVAAALRFYLRTALAADHFLDPGRRLACPCRPAWGRYRLSDPAAALAWFAERGAILAALALADKPHRSSAVAGNQPSNAGQRRDRSGEYDNALAHYREAPTLSEQSGDSLGWADTHISLLMVLLAR
jgi:hypothetical protein